MKKIFLLFAIAAALISCKKSEDQNPQPEINFSDWANQGNNVFNDGSVGTVSSSMDSLVHVHSDSELK